MTYHLNNFILLILCLKNSQNQNENNIYSNFNIITLYFIIKT